MLGVICMGSTEDQHAKSTHRSGIQSLELQEPGVCCFTVMVTAPSSDPAAAVLR